MGIASGINNSVVALWKRVGTVISPKTDGDDITTTGTFSGINVTSGESPGHTHDNSYYTETEVDSNYLAIDGGNADQDIDIGSYNLTTAGDLDVGDISLSKNIYHSGTITAVGTKYVQHYLHIDGYYKTDPEDANVLGWNIGMDVAIDGDITADNLGTASAQDVGYFEPAKGTDDNFVTDYQLSILSTLVSHTWVNS